MREPDSSRGVLQVCSQTAGIGTFFLLLLFEEWEHILDLELYT